MSYQLTFTSVHNYGTEALIVPIELEFVDKLVRTDAFVDTGATFCVFKRELATALELMSRVERLFVSAQLREPSRRMVIV